MTNIFQILALFFVFFLVATSFQFSRHSYRSYHGIGTFKLGMAGFGTNKNLNKSPSKSVGKITEFGNETKGQLTLTNKQLPTITFEDAVHTYQNHLPSLNTSYPGLRLIHNDPPVYEIDNFFTQELCQDYINRSATDGFEVLSQTFSSSALSKRTSTTWFLKYKSVPEFLYKIKSLTNVPLVNYEEPQIVRYEFGQQFTWHYDYIPQPLQDSSGNRVATVLVYLNDVANGGATCFQDLNIQVKPQTGKALLFFPCYRDGRLDERTMHAGQVTMDTKWIAQMLVP